MLQQQFDCLRFVELAASAQRCINSIRQRPQMQNQVCVTPLDCQTETNVDGFVSMYGKQTMPLQYPEYVNVLMSCGFPQ
jgi:hypothetical protein